MFLFIIGISFGIFAAAGVFTVFVVIGMVPRFAVRINAVDKIVLFEEMLIAGTMFGAIIIVFDIEFKLQGIWLYGSLLLCGINWGIFVGCLAISISEIMDCIPILARRSELKHGMKAALFFMALGKMAGSLIYFILWGK